MSKPDTLINLRNYLIAQGTVRDPFDAGSLPALWTMPLNGLVAANSGDGVIPSDPVVGIYRSPGATSAPYEGFIRQDVVLFEVRTSPTTPKGAYDFEDTVRALLHDRRAWIMGILPINESMLVRDIQQGDSSSLGYSFTFQYNFNMWGPFQPAP